MEERVRLLEQTKQTWTNFPGPLEEEEEVDKSVVVIGGFQGKEVDEVEALVQELMVGIRAYKEVEVLDATPPLAMATFDSPMEAMKFIRAQKRHATMQSHGLRASENRSKTERMCCKATSKLKKFMIEIGGFEAKDVHDVHASYKTFRIMVRKHGKLIPVACFHGKVCVTWMDQHVVNQAVRDALEACVAELEWERLKVKLVDCRQLVLLRGMGPHASSTNDAQRVEEFIHLHVLSKNFQSIRAERRYCDFMSELDMCDFDIMCLSETWQDCREEIVATPHGHTVYLSGDARHCGVGICVCKNLLLKISNVSFHALGGRLCYLSFTLGRRHFAVFSCYFPTSWAPDADVFAQYDILKLLLTHVRDEGRSLFIAGDFNASIGPVHSFEPSDVIGHCGMGERNERGDALVQFVLEEGLCMVCALQAGREMQIEWMIAGLAAGPSMARRRKLTSFLSMDVGNS